MTYLNDVSEIWLGKKALRKIIKYDTVLQHDAVLRNYYDSTKTKSIGILDSVLYQLRNEEFEAASILNNLIPDTNLLERNEKRVNAIELNHLMTNSDYSQTEINELRELALKCPFIDGKAVYRARTLLVEVDSFNTDYINECEQLMSLNLRSMETNQDSSIENAKFVIYPNPSNGLITITCSQVNTDKQFTFEMFNMVGQSIKTTDIIFNANTAEININELSNGVYYYRISDQTGAIESGKIVLLKP